MYPRFIAKIANWTEYPPVIDPQEFDGFLHITLRVVFFLYNIYVDFDLG